MCLAGAVVASWFLTQEVAGLKPFTVMANIIVNSVRTFRKNSIKTAVCVCRAMLCNANFSKPVPQTKKLPYCAAKFETAEQNRTSSYPGWIKVSTCGNYPHIVSHLYQISHLACV